MLNNLLQMHLKPLQKKRFKKQKKQLVILLEIKLLLKLLESEKLHHKITQKKTLNMIENYIEKDVHLQNKNRKLLMIEGKYNMY